MKARIEIDVTEEMLTIYEVMFEMALHNPDKTPIESLEVILNKQLQEMIDKTYSQYNEYVKEMRS